MTDLLPTTLQALKSADPDRYRAALMAEEQGRRDLLTLYAFHYELAKVPDVTTEPMLGEIRYQWWRDAVDEIYGEGEVRRHEVSTLLSEMVKRRDIPRFWIDRLIDGRARDLDPRPFADLEEAREYCRQTSGILIQIAAKTLGVDAGEGVLKAGEAWGLTGLARAYGYYHDRMLSELKFEDLVKVAGNAHGEARAQLAQSPAEIFPAIAYAALIPGFVKRLSKSGFDPKVEKVDYSPVAKQARLMMAGLRGKI
ncbi:squalene/phytoene synthase family protein [Litorimonas sp. WD9-15]|uniref:squalene/phytoene synthase family protein n=1 Tax=Litorimonas sp. WD9-15 TaxID=3418716 RepID=UPI003CFF1D1C